MIYAKIEISTGKLLQFIGVNSPEMLEFQKSQFTQCVFVESEYFGSPTDFTYNQATKKIEPLKE